MPLRLKLPSFRLRGVPVLRGMSGLRDLRVSLFVKITALIAVSTLLVVAANLASVYRTTSRIATTGLQDSAQTSVDGLRVRLQAPVRFADAARVRLLAEDAIGLAEGDLVAVVVTGADGAIIAATGGEVAQVAERLATVAGAAEALALSGDIAGHFVVAAPIEASADGPRTGAVATLWTTRSALARAHADDWRLLVSAGVILLVMLALATFAVRRMIALPMGRLATSLSALAEGAYDRPIAELERGDEIGAFSRHVADLRDRLRIAQDDEEARTQEHEEQMRVVSALRDGLNALSQRNLSVELETPFHDRYEALREDYNATASALRDTITAVITASSRMRAASEDIAGSADNLSSRTETQAATLEQTAAAIQQISTRISETASNARQAEEIARGAQEQAQVSEPIVREAIEAMAAIQKRSSQISQIITLIDDISFQTNLLALNAGVEAARAGDAGRGFAVVASEVRALAQRSSDAAREIKELVTGSAEQVNHGVDLVRRSGSTLSAFAGQVDDIAGLMSVVAQAADDQAHSVTEINVGVTQLDTVTQQNAAMVQETTVAIHELRQQATDLVALLRNFELGSGSAVGAGNRGAAAMAPGRAVA